MAVQQGAIVRILVGSAIGNAIEWYNFLAYGILAHIIAELFFPQEDKYISLILTFSVFAIGFLARPIGGLIFGILGDKYGRKVALVFSLNLMIVSTLLMAVLPTYQHFGIIATLLLLFSRILQGISVGGEYTSSFVYIAEHSPPHKRGFYISFMPLTVTLGILIGTFVCLFFTTILSHKAMLSWGWRAIFLIGAILGVLGIAARKKLPETNVFEKLQQENLIEKNPIRTLLKNNKINLTSSFFLAATYGIQYQIYYIWMTNYLESSLRFSNSSALMLVSTNLLVFICFAPIYGVLVDSLSSKKVLLVSLLLEILLTGPLFIMLNLGSVFNVYLATITMTIIFAAFTIAFTNCLVDFFPANLRLSGISVSYNMAFALLGGTSPLVVTWLIKVTENQYMPTYYIIVSALIAFITICIGRSQKF